MTLRIQPSKFRTLKLAFLICLLSGEVYSQVTFEEKWDISRVNSPMDIKQTQDMGYCISGTASYPPSYMFGGKFDIFLLRLNDTSGTKWMKAYYNAASPQDDNKVYSLCETADSGFILGGHIAVDYGTTLGLIFKTDKNGNILWERELNQPGLDVIKVIPTLDKGYLAMVGGGFFFSAGVIVKLDSLGNVKWSNNYSDNTSAVGISSALQMQDSTYVVGGIYSGGILLMNLSTSGNILWKKSYKSGATSQTLSSYVDLIRTTSGGFMLTTENDSIFGGADISVACTDIQGNLLWNKVYGTMGKEENPRISRTAEGNYIVSLESYGIPGITEGILNIKMNEAGEILWSRAYKGLEHQEEVVNTATNDGGAFMLCHLLNGQTMYAVKTDINGVSGCNDVDQPVKDTAIVLNTLTPSITIQAGPSDTLIGLTAADMTGTRNILCYNRSSAVLPKANFLGDTIVCKGSCVSYTDLSINSPTNWNWKFTGGSASSSAAKNPSPVCYNTDGNFTVTLIASNSAGSDTMIRNIKVISVSAGVISATHDTICEGTITHLSDAGSSGGPIQWQWSEGGGKYNNITGATGVSYTTSPLSQSPSFRIFVTNGACTDTSLPLKIITVPAPQAVFSASGSGKVVTYNSDNSQGAVNFTWDFGDGEASTDPNPLHTYDTAGTYHVCLTTRNNTNCTFTVCNNVTVFNTGINNIADGTNWQVYPDPFSNYIFVRGLQADKTIETIDVYDLLGRKTYSREFRIPGLTQTVIQLPELSQGVYFLKIKTKDSAYIHSIIKK